MNGYHYKLLNGILITVLLAAIVGCSTMTAGVSSEKDSAPDSAARAEALVVLSSLKNHNAGLKNIKGIGNVRVWQAGRLKIDERIAWVGSDPGRINIAVLIGGHPAVKMASDGNWFYYYEAGTKKPIYKKYAASNASLKRLISVAIQTDDVLDLLAGRVPIRDHHSAILHQLEDEPGWVLVLKRRWWGTIQKIYLDEDKTRTPKIEFFSRTGSLIYRARFDALQTIDNYRVPSRLKITDGRDVQFELDIKRYLANVDVTPSMFVLNPPR